MKSRIVVRSMLAALLMLLGTQLFAQSNPEVRNSSNPPAFQKYAAPVSSRLAFLASDKGKQVLLHSPSPMARSLLVRYHGAEAAAEWDRTPHAYRAAGAASKPTSLPAGRQNIGAAAGISRCAATRFNLEPAAGAMPQNEQTIDFKYQGVSANADEVGEGSNDFRGLFDPPAVWSPSLTGYYFERSAGCSPQFEGGTPPIPDPFGPATRMWGGGDPILNYDANHDAWFYSSIYFDDYYDGIGVFRNTNNNIMNATVCPSGTHNIFASISCWPLGPAKNGVSAIIVDEQPTYAGYEADKPDSWIDSRTSGTGAGDVYISDTLFEGGSSVIDLTACKNLLTPSSCSYAIQISGSDYSAQFSDIKTQKNGTVTITYANFSTMTLPGPLYRYINIVDIKYVTCTPNGAPNPPSCNYPVLVATDYQPVTSLAQLTDVRNDTYPVHIERAGLYPFVFWERCASTSDLPFGGDVEGGITCPNADIVAAYSVDGGNTWSAPYGIDTSAGHQIQPWAAYDSGQDIINVVYQNCNSAYMSQCQVGFRQIPSGSITPGAFLAMSSYAAPESEANRPYFQPLFGDYIGANVRGPGSAGNSHLWIGYTDTTRQGIYGFGTQPLNESNNNLAAWDY